jgi:hypothetical protein
MVVVIVKFIQVDFVILLDFLLVSSLMKIFVSNLWIIALILVPISPYSQYQKFYFSFSFI